MMTATGRPFLVTTTRSWVPVTSSITWLKRAFTAARDCVVMTRIMVIEPVECERRGEQAATDASRPKSPSEHPSDRRDLTGCRHVKAPRASDPVVELQLEGLGPHVVALVRRGSTRA